MENAEIRKVPVGELVDGLIAGDDESWRKFLRAAGPLIMSVCRRSDLSDDEIDDIAQSLVLKLLDRDCRVLRRLKVGEERSFYRWVKVTLSRTVIDYVRASGVRRSREQMWGESLWEEVLSGNPADRIEQRIAIEDAVAGLSPEEQTLFQLDFGGLKDKEIAGILGLGLPAAQQRLSRLRKKLRKIMEGAGVARGP